MCRRAKDERDPAYASEAGCARRRVRSTSTVPELQLKV